MLLFANCIQINVTYLHIYLVPEAKIRNHCVAKADPRGGKTEELQLPPNHEDLW